MFTNFSLPERVSVHYDFALMIKGLGHIRGIVRRDESSFFTPRKRRQHAPSSQGQSVAPRYTRVETSKAPLAGALSYIITRPRVGKRLGDILKPMHAATSVDEMKRFFTPTTLAKVRTLAKACPRKVRAVLKKSAKTPKALYASLVALACGDDSSHATALAAMRNLKGNHALALDCIGGVVKFNTRGSRRLIEALFDHSKKLTPAMRVTLFKRLAMTKGLAYKETLVECFGKIMENTTPLERNRMYASLLSWTDKWKPLDTALRGNRAYVQECLRGQLSTCPVATKGNHLLARRIIGLPRSARG